MTGLRFLAAKAAAHAPARHGHGVVLKTQRMRNPVLNLARVLRARMNPPLVLLERQRIGHLAFEIEMLLAADFELAGERVPRLFHRRVGIAAADGHRRQNIALRGMRIAWGKNGGQWRNVENHLARCAAGLHHRIGHHQRHNLSDVLDLVPCKHRLVVDKGRQRAVAGDVAGQDDTPHTGHLQCRTRIDSAQQAVRNIGHDRCRVQGAFDLRDVVDVRRAACNLGPGALMRT